MAKVHILLYRQWDIYFSTESERFIVENGANEIQKDKLSFAAACAFVDAFIKENAVFEPFKVERHGYRSRGSGEVVTVIGIRKDGRFIIENGKGEKAQVSEYDEDSYKLINPKNEPILLEIQSIEAEIETVLAPLKEKLKGAEDKLKYQSLRDQRLTGAYSDWVEKKTPNRFGQD